MTIVSLPRTATRRPHASSTRSGRHHRRTTATPRVLPSLWGTFWSLSASFKIGAFLATPVLVVMVAVTYGAQTQVDLTVAQQNLAQAQANYAHEVNTLAQLTAPERITTAGTVNHLSVPTSVSQITSTGLSKPLALPRFSRHVAVLSRVVTTPSLNPRVTTSPTPAHVVTTALSHHGTK